MEHGAGRWGAWLLLWPLLVAAEPAWCQEPASNAGSAAPPRFDLFSASGSESRPSPLELLREAILQLRQLPDSNRRVKRSVGDVVEAISESLSHKGESLYLDGRQIRSYPDGKRVFKYCKRALRRLQRGFNSVRGNREVLSVFERVAENLLEAQTEIARASIEAAQRLSALGLADEWQVERALRELERAGRHDDSRKAMDALKKAWEVSQQAVRRQSLAVIAFRDSPDPFSSGAGYQHSVHHFQDSGPGTLFAGLCSRHSGFGQWRGDPNIEQSSLGRHGRNRSLGARRELSLSGLRAAHEADGVRPAPGKDSRAQAG